MNQNFFSILKEGEGREGRGSLTNHKSLCSNGCTYCFSGSITEDQK